MSDHPGDTSKDIENYNWRKRCGILCRQCNRIYTKEINYYRHYSEKHPGQDIIFTCTLCQEDIDNFKKFRNHCYRHVIADRYKCDFCTKLFSQKCHLNEHIENFHGNALNCKICQKSFKTTSNLNRHVREIHNTKEYRCDDCGKILHSVTSLQVHVSTHKLENYYMCDLCGKRFSQKSNLKTHIKIHEAPLFCDFCPKTFANKNQLNEHLVTHSNTKKYECTICKKWYKTESYLKKHLKNHTEEKPLLCNICNKRFSRIVKLTDHMNVHMGEKPYKCKYCEMTFTNNPNCLKHIRKRHKIDPKTGEPLDLNASLKKYECKSCNKCYKSEIYLKKHLKNHTEEKPMLCNISNEQHSRIVKLTDHMNVHMGKKPYKCKYCEITFTNNQNCLKHIRIRHKIDPNTGKPLDLNASKNESERILKKIDLQKSSDNSDNNNGMDIDRESFNNYIPMNINVTNREKYICSESIANNNINKKPLTSPLRFYQNNECFEFTENNTNMKIYPTVNSSTELANTLVLENTENKFEMFQNSGTASDFNINPSNQKQNDALQESMYQSENILSNMITDNLESKLIEDFLPHYFPEFQSQNSLNFLSCEEIHQVLELTESDGISEIQMMESSGNKTNSTCYY